MDSFDRDNQIRKIIAELIRPLMESADTDRQACASLTYQVSLISDRLKTVEYLTKVEGEKP